MTIRRIQVEEGFLDGLDLSFASGLNVLIGPRGAGKTSIIELIRFALGAAALTDNVAQSSKEHALSILGSGSVTVTMNDGGEDFILKRTAETWTTTGPKNFTPPVILSQNEIESIGLQASGRLRLIDSIRSVDETPDQGKESTLLSYILSQTVERRVFTNELQAVRQQLRGLAEQLKEADVLKKQHAEALSGIEKAQAQNQRLAQLNGWLCAALGRLSIKLRSGTTSTRSLAAVRFRHTFGLAENGHLKSRLATKPYLQPHTRFRFGN